MYCHINDPGSAPTGTRRVHCNRKRHHPRSRAFIGRNFERAPESIHPDLTRFCLNHRMIPWLKSTNED